MENNSSRDNQAYKVEAIGPFQAQAPGEDEILKVTALLYLKEALVAQEYESCPELIDAAKNLGASPGDISAVIASYLRVSGMRTGYLNADDPARQKGGRVRSY